MTLRPGDWIKFRGKPRFVLYAGPGQLIMEKIGRSWTDPHPCAHYSIGDPEKKSIRRLRRATPSTFRRAKRLFCTTYPRKP